VHSLGVGVLTVLVLGTAMWAYVRVNEGYDTEGEHGNVPHDLTKQHAGDATLSPSQRGDLMLIAIGAAILIIVITLVSLVCGVLALRDLDISARRNSIRRQNSRMTINESFNKEL
jgi:hypothetical protein